MAVNETGHEINTGVSVSVVETDDGERVYTVTADFVLATSKEVAEADELGVHGAVARLLERRFRRELRIALGLD